jgi:hypothetical protein
MMGVTMFIQVALEVLRDSVTTNTLKLYAYLLKDVPNRKLDLTLINFHNYCYYINQLYNLIVL